jgi:glycosyltransferase involved in cell wall biosynthesis
MTSEWKEQFGMVLLEAMASGVPVVASRSGGIPEIVGYSGLLFTPGDHRELATLVEHLLTSREEWNRLRESGLERCRLHFSAHDNSKRILDLYRRFSRQIDP